MNSIAILIFIDPISADEKCPSFSLPEANSSCFHFCLLSLHAESLANNIFRGGSRRQLAPAPIPSKKQKSPCLPMLGCFPQ